VYIFLVLYVLATYSCDSDITCMSTLTEVVAFLNCWLHLDSSVSIVTCCKLDGPGIESWNRCDFLHLSKPTLGSSQHLVQWVLELPGVKQLGFYINHPSPSGTKFNTLKPNPERGLVSSNLLCSPHPSATHACIFTYLL
jgi:hypothetical protein